MTMEGMTRWTEEWGQKWKREGEKMCRNGMNREKENGNIESECDEKGDGHSVRDRAQRQAFSSLLRPIPL